MTPEQIVAIIKEAPTAVGAALLLELFPDRFTVHPSALDGARDARRPERLPPVVAPAPSPSLEPVPYTCRRCETVSSLAGGVLSGVECRGCGDDLGEQFLASRKHSHPTEPQQPRDKTAIDLSRSTPLGGNSSSVPRENEELPPRRVVRHVTRDADPAGQRRAYDIVSFNPPTELECWNCGAPDDGVVVHCAQCGKSLVSNKTKNSAKQGPRIQIDGRDATPDEIAKATAQMNRDAEEQLRQMREGTYTPVDRTIFPQDKTHGKPPTE